VLSGPPTGDGQAVGFPTMVQLEQANQVSLSG
jgi:hypothetical protein